MPAARKPQRRGLLLQVRELAAQGGQILFVGTKKQAQEPVREEAERCGGFFVNTRWLGGMLTNFQTIKASIDRLKKLEEMLEDPNTQEVFTKKEILNLSRERDKLDLSLGGIKDMRKLPDAVFVIDPKREEIAVKEANKLGIPVIAVVDTNCDPELVDYKIPGNDDAIRAVRLFCSSIADAIILMKDSNSTCNSLISLRWVNATAACEASDSASCCSTSPKLSTSPVARSLALMSCSTPMISCS